MNTPADGRPRWALPLEGALTVVVLELSYEQPALSSEVPFVTLGPVEVGLLIAVDILSRNSPELNQRFDSS